MSCGIASAEMLRETLISQKASNEQTLRKARRGIKVLRCDQGLSSSQRRSREEPELQLCTQGAQVYTHPSFVRSPVHGPREDKVEGNDAYRVRVQRGNGPPVPRRAPRLDWLKAGVSDGSGNPV